jgi:glyoxylase-like metal-dependent hydrolase (beta-lactamase superfamily II)
MITDSSLTSEVTGFPGGRRRTVADHDRRESRVLTQVSERALIHTSAFCRSNAVVVHGDAGVLLVDAGVQRHEMSCLANDLRAWGQPVVAGFSTHPHWDHLLWDAQLGSAPRYATARCAATVRERLSGADVKDRVARMLPPDIADQIPLDLLGVVSGLPDKAARVPWDGPKVQVVEHQAHAPGHAALVIEELGVLVVGDMLSDVLIPLLDMGAADPIEDYLAGLGLLEGLLGGVGLVIPGHGSVSSTEQARARIEQDRAYVHALRDGRTPDDPRIGTSAEPGWEWVDDVHVGQSRRLAERGERDTTSG